MDIQSHHGNGRSGIDRSTQRMRWLDDLVDCGALVTLADNDSAEGRSLGIQIKQRLHLQPQQ